MKPIVIGLSGRAGCGKTSIAQSLCKQYFGSRVSFADTIRQMLHPVIDQLYYNDPPEKVNDTLTVNKEDMIEELGASPRYLMQHLGGLFREINPDTFVHLTEKKIEMLQDINDMLSRLTLSIENIESYAYIIDDLRYDNEAEWIKSKMGGTIFYIDRDESLLKPVPDHHSENGIRAKYIDHTYENTDNESALEQIAFDIAGKMGLTEMPIEKQYAGKFVMPTENNNVH